MGAQRQLLKRWRVTEDVAQRRANWIRMLGFQGFNEYLESPLWGSIYARVIQRDKGRCRYCKSETKCTQFLRYEIEQLSGRDISQIFTVCWSCLYQEDPSDREKRLHREKREARQRKINRLIREQNADRFSVERKRKTFPGVLPPGSRRL